MQVSAGVLGCPWAAAMVFRLWGGMPVAFACFLGGGEDLGRARVAWLQDVLFGLASR